MTSGHPRNLRQAAGAPNGLRRIIENCRGATLVEAAIVLPVFVMIVFGIIATGLLMWTQLSLDYAVAVLARCAAINNASCGSNGLIQTYAQQNKLPLIQNVTISFPSPPSCGNGNKQITASYNFASMVQPLLPWLQPLVPYSSLTLQATACYKTS